MRALVKHDGKGNAFFLDISSDVAVMTPFFKLPFLILFFRLEPLLY